jgi:hypothetical protein
MIKEIYVRKPHQIDITAGAGPGAMFRDEKAERERIDQERKDNLSDLDTALNNGYQCIGNHTSGAYQVYVLHKHPKKEKYIPHPDSPHSSHS